MTQTKGRSTGPKDDAELRDRVQELEATVASLREELAQKDAELKSAAEQAARDARYR